MKLKAQHPKPRRSPRTSRPAAARMGARPRGRQARRPGVPLRHRLRGRLPSIRRLLAGTAAVAAIAGLVALLNGPFLRVSAVGWTGDAYTTRGRNVLAVDTRAVEAALERLPSVAEADVRASLTGVVEAALVEPRVAFVWDTRRARLLVADDGTIFSSVDAEAALPDALAGVPRILDERRGGRSLRVGDELPSALLAPTREVLGIDPTALGSATPGVAVHLDDEYGFRLVSTQPAWEIALGVYGTDPRETVAEATARLERQVTAVRTLFTSRAETGISWVDVRNPGKVYFRAGG
jgi:hypothetical protein